MVYDAARSVVLLFGGSDLPGPYYGDTWELGLTKPQIIESPVSQTVRRGQAVVFAVQAEGTGTLRYQWRKDGVPLVDDDRISGATTDTLTIDPVELPDAGNYDVVVTDDCGSATSDPATLTVVCAGDVTGDGDTDQADLGMLLGD
jgi:hypothetical protein